jgi:hypothetical protein
VPRLLYIVSRQNQLVYTSLMEAFADDPNVGVILDRRHRERRERTRPPRVDNRTRERRSFSIEEHLQEIGWAVADARSDVEGEG